MLGGNSVRRSRDPLEGVASGLTVTSVTAPLTLGNNGAQSDVPVSALGFANGFPGAWYDHVGAADVDLQRQRPPAGRRAADDTRDSASSRARTRTVGPAPDSTAGGAARATGLVHPRPPLPCRAIATF